MVNPALASGQLIGGLSKGQGYALIEDKMIEFGVRYLQTIARRKGIEKLYPGVMKPVATVYEYDRGGEHDGRKLYAKQHANNQNEQMDRGK